MLPRNFDTLLRSSRVCILGFGLEGQAAFNFLEKRVPLEQVVIADANVDTQVPDGLSSFLGDAWRDAIAEVDVIIRSPGIPLHQLPEISDSQVLTSGTEIFLDKHRDRCIGITGSKGKSTTATLLASALESQGYDIRLIGNIGLPALEAYEDNPDYFVLELSSYQLETCGISPHISMLLNLFQEHLDFHQTFERYAASKINIYKYQTENDYLCLHRAVRDFDMVTSSLQDQKVVPSRASVVCENDSVYLNGLSKPYEIKEQDFPLKGKGNYQNLELILDVVLELGLKDEVLLLDSLKNFQPLAHRMSVVAECAGIIFVNDSIATIPEASINAIDTFQDDLKYLILGGYDRGVDYSSLVDRVLNTAIKKLALFEPSGSRILQLLIERNQEFNIETCVVKNMDEAVNFFICDRSTMSSEKEVCLLSPASPSFPMFKNFEDRGRAFEFAVKSIHM